MLSTLIDYRIEQIKGADKEEYTKEEIVLMLQKIVEEALDYEKEFNDEKEELENEIEELEEKLEDTCDALAEMSLEYE